MPDGASYAMHDTPPAEPWPDPDISVLRLHRRAAPTLPLEVFGPEWQGWIEGAAEAASCPSDYVAAPLLASAIGADRQRALGASGARVGRTAASVVRRSGRFGLR